MPGAEGLMFEWPRAHKLEKAPDYVAAKPKHIRDLLGIEIASKLNTKHALIKGIDSIYAPFFAREDKIGFVTHREEGYLNNWQWVSNPPEEISHASFDIGRLYSVAGDPRNRARPLPIVGGAKVTLRYVIKKDQMEK
ncbi:hypothetical protein OAN22_01890 [Alphaproteobacteria bacterium]|nr:hypothetical protein [Alphaproteobacteria bacterium]